jgi:hypothetical protein
MKIVKGICEFMGALFLDLFILTASVLIVTGISVCILWIVDMLCGTSFYTWENVGILTIALVVFNRARGGKN